MIPHLRKSILQFILYLSTVNWNKNLGEQWCSSVASCILQIQIFKEQKPLCHYKICWNVINSKYFYFCTATDFVNKVEWVNFYVPDATKVKTTCRHSRNYLLLRKSKFHWHSNSVVWATAKRPIRTLHLGFVLRSYLLESRGTVYILDNSFSFHFLAWKEQVSCKEIYMTAGEQEVNRVYGSESMLDKKPLLL
jgi:hypothetical protein